ncbi:uncharacterized protein A4U43_C01F12950 [Asparagus officinalis]|uniref:Uncharacterized protein n=1 Tax=Asparagus officinalis TaxID=4686 RepID=A0A5P1FQL9_ASPOF|nr:uncharacterized protein A4U43_C01F12950 [Asparagus officinalis]
MEHIRTSYLKLLGEVESMRASRGVDSRRAAKARALEATKVEKLRQELEESRRKAKGLSKALQKRDHTKAQDRQHDRVPEVDRFVQDHQYDRVSGVLDLAAGSNGVLYLSKLQSPGSNGVLDLNQSESLGQRKWI